ncbi:hypothetical protein MSG28_012221 [Choristoneura fumiferana]|uniref:Uncharacterized protein n=1 Tax=Choristoneura fumiferana TaxID=7141 RepID=A0ACC0KCS8_CHOFU|nr:hypothetical protein MSG28_012221 [Choristoneura fumiferana]
MRIAAAGPVCESVTSGDRGVAASLVIAMDRNPGFGTENSRAALARSRGRRRSACRSAAWTACEKNRNSHDCNI